MNDDMIYEREDLLKFLDAFLADRHGGWWDGFYADRARECPFFVEWPDENLVRCFDEGPLSPGRILELGCGNGRNALYMAGKGCSVDAVDFSQSALDWARERTSKAGLTVNYICESMFRTEIAPESYDIVYDAGCFHHLPPHRRKDYVELVEKALKPGGSFGLVCFRPEGGSGFTDRDVYEKRSLGGGLGYTEEKLRFVFSRAFTVIEVKQMKEMNAESRLFGKDFLWTILMRKEPR